MYFSKKSSRIFVLQALAFSLVLIAMASSGWNQPASAASDFEQAVDRIWHEADADAIESKGTRRIVPDEYRTLRVDYDALVDRLEQAPMEFTPESYDTNTVMILPLPNGIDERFRIFESPVMAPGLAKKFPEIKTYYAVGLDDPHSSGRLDLTPAGFHAMIFTAADTFYIDPFSTDSGGFYISYFKQDYSAPEDMVYNELGPLGEPEYLDPVEDLRVGENLRKHRLALATTGEYSIYHGGTEEKVMAEVVTAINRVTGIYEREVAVRLELIANNELLIFLDPETDPYTNSSGSTMLGQNQATIDTLIGDANYDIGHVFSTGGGGVAYLRVVCDSGWKARGVTGLSHPIGDPFYVDYVAHEMGHQYGGNHTFNGTTGSCNGNRSASAAYEPGSGTTIMAYAGICSPQNTQNYSDDYFHTKSFDEMIAFTTTGDGAGCGTVTSTGNNPPVVDAGEGGFTIPIETPFTLVGSATDPNSDPMTYNWEEYDLGPAGHPDSPVANAPIFRSFLAKASPIRVFPQISDIVNSTHTIGEILPTYSRNLTFRLTARDNHPFPSAGGVAYDTITFDVTDQAGPFEVIVPNTAVSWAIGSLENVTWDVANTDAAPVSCSSVDIFLSPDGGYVYSTTIITGTLNDGSQRVIVPDVPTSTARLMVKCTDNVFFDISDDNFSIVDSPPFARLEAMKSVETEGEVNLGEMLTYTIDIVNSGNATATTTITDTFDSALIDPVCNEVAGDLTDQMEIPGATITTYSCTAQVDPTLNIQIKKTVDQEVIFQRTAVTYTIAVTNPNTSTSIDDVVVSDPDVGLCTPDLGTPTTLGPMTSQIYVCPGVIPSIDITNTAEVIGTVSIENVASASAPEDEDSPVSSDTVVHHAYLNATDSASVIVEFASLSLVKSVNPATDLEPSDLITYTIAISNSGNITASMTVTDTFDSALIDPACNGVAGDLADQIEIPGATITTYLCTAQVDPTLNIQIKKTVDQEVIFQRTAVTYTIAVTNPNTSTSIDDVVVSDPDVGLCTPDLGTPITLGPMTSQIYVCPGVIPSSDITNTAEVIGTVSIENVASASAPEDIDSPVSSDTIVNHVYLSAIDSASVMIKFASLSLLKSVNPASDLEPSDLITYTIALSNSGNITASITVTDTFDSALIDPVCNGVAGDLTDQMEIPGATKTTYSCTAQVDPTLDIQIEKVVDEAVIFQGMAVTYTITITNPNAVTSIEDVVVSDPHVGLCTPNPGNPITLGPMTSQIYVCPDVVPTSDVTNTAEVSGTVSIENMASVSAPEDEDSPVSSNTVVNHVYLNATDSASVIVEFASLSLVKSVSPATDLEPSDLITYTIAVSNSGNITASMIVTDTFDTALIEPSCNGAEGNLSDRQILGVDASIVYLCSARVEPSLAIEIGKAVDDPEPISGSEITYTIAVTNPNQLATLENIVVTDPDVGTCSPSLSTPIQLDPLASQVYVCPDVAAAEDLTNTAFVSADVVIRNSASASAPEDASSPISTNRVENYVSLSDSDSVSVTVRYHIVFMPLLEKGTDAPAIPRTAATTMGFSVVAVVLGVVATMRRRRID